MSRRRKNRANRDLSASWGGSGTPPASYPTGGPSTRFFFSSRTAPYPRGTRAFALAPYVSPKTRSTPYLIGTVFTDTTFSRRTSRPPLVSPLRRRQSPDLPNAALARSNPWNTFVDQAMPSLSDQVPSRRAITCARRSIRRQVLLALGRGNGGGSRFVPKSKVRCS